MIVPKPMYISARLMAALDIHDHSGKVGTLSVSANGEWLVEDGEHVELDSGSDLRCPMAQDYGEIMGSLLSFLGACAESRTYARQTGRDGENSDLFNDECGAWAEQNSDELAMMQYELERDGEES